MGLTDQKREAINALARGGNDSSVSRALEVNRATIGRWKKDPEFAAALAKARGEAGEEAVEGLGMLAPEALKMLKGYLEGTLDIPAAKAGVALNVIKAVATVEKTEGASSSVLEERLKLLDTRDAG